MAWSQYNSPAPAKDGLLVELHELFVGWRTSYGQLAAAFCFDGLVGEDERAWAAANPRVMFLAKESNDRNGVMAAAGYSLTKLLRESNAFPQNRKVFERTLAIWAFGLQSMARGAELDYARAAKDAEAIKAAFLSSAVMNLKKSPGGGRCDVASLRSAAMRDAYWIARQIEILDPTLVICCGTFKIAAQILGGMRQIRGIPRAYQRAEAYWIDHWHPSYAFAKGGPEALYTRLMEAALPLLRVR